jgi:hypothetical protein
MLQDFVAGEVPDVLTLPHMRQLLEFWQRQLGAAGEEDGQWVSDVVTALRSGTEELFIDHRALREAPDPRVRALLAAAAGAGEAVRPGLPRTGDVVHGDFHHRNILVRGDRVVARVRLGERPRRRRHARSRSAYRVEVAD